jgi:hypothetical protein
MAQDPVLEALFIEYKEMRQELRDLINSMNTNLQVGILALAATVGWGMSSQGDKRVLFTIPTIIVAFTVIHLLKTTAANVLGTYCQIVAARIRRQVNSEERVFDWEGGLLWEHMAAPTSIVQAGFYLFFAIIALLFAFFAWQAYIVYKWSIIVHGVELIAALSYAVAAIAWNLKKGRRVWLEKYRLPVAD